MILEKMSIELTCRICSNINNNDELLSPDLWDSSLKSYQYFECDACGCLQIVSYPEDIQAIYPQDYYAHRRLEVPPARPFRNWLRKQWIDHGLTGRNPIGWLLGEFKSLPMLYRVMGKHGVNKASSVLDVGCGDGTFLLWLGRTGFGNVVGIDPYIPEDKELPDGTKLFRRFVFEETGEYDFITLNHSFEHMQDQARVLSRLHDLLQNDGLLMISIPVLGYAWFEYGIYWWGLDAPRHFYLHTNKSLQTLCNQTGFEIVDIVYNSTYWQFVGSGLLQRGITRKSIENGNFQASEFYAEADINRLRGKANELNLAKDGDQAMFFMKKTLRLTQENIQIARLPEPQK